MQNIVLVKSAGKDSALNILDKVGAVKYPGKYHGSSSGFGASSNQLAMHIDDGETNTNADTALAAIEIPTCAHSSLDITVNVGTYVVTDVTSIVADGSDTKFVKVTVAVDDTTGDPEVVVYEKTTGAYGNVPAGKTHATDLKEYSVPASGSTLTEINDWIS